LVNEVNRHGRHIKSALFPYIDRIYTVFDSNYPLIGNRMKGGYTHNDLRQPIKG
jgi:hypothetical protein